MEKIDKHLFKLPEVGKIYKFYDDGKTGASRRYWAKVLRVLPYNEACTIGVKDYNNEIHLLTWYWKNAVNEHNWVYAEETDYFVECWIPGYDENNIWFVRTKSGRWFSIDIQSFWQGGLLDVDNTWYPECPDDYYTYWENTWEDDVEYFNKHFKK